MLDISELQYLGSGTGRDVYLLPGGKWVLKVPRNWQGDLANEREARYRYDLDPYAGKERVFARCRLIPGTFLLVMEYIEPNTKIDYCNLPRWTDFIDCRQVGFDRKGRLKAYDFG